MNFSPETNFRTTDPELESRQRLQQLQIPELRVLITALSKEPRCKSASNQLILLCSRVARLEQRFLTPRPTITEETAMVEKNLVLQSLLYCLGQLHIPESVALEIWKSYAATLV